MPGLSKIAKGRENPVDQKIDLILEEYKATGDLVVETLLLFGEPDHDKADEENRKRDEFGKEADRCPCIRDPATLEVCHLCPYQNLSGCCLAP
jgi:hypothetical protein